MKRFSVFFSCLLLCSCSSGGNVLKYGFLPGGDYQYYAPIEQTDLKKTKYNLIISDERSGINKINCSDISLDRNTELEGPNGFEFFKNYCRAMFKANNGIIESTSENDIYIKLKGLSAQYYGFVFVKIYGLVEFEVVSKNLSNTYCSEMKDGDNDAPLKTASFDTRKGALRKMASGTTRRALEKFMHDLSH